MTRAGERNGARQLAPCSVILSCALSAINHLRVFSLPLPWFLHKTVTETANVFAVPWTWVSFPRPQASVLHSHLSRSIAPRPEASENGLVKATSSEACQLAQACSRSRSTHTLCITFSLGSGFLLVFFLALPARQHPSITYFCFLSVYSCLLCVLLGANLINTEYVSSWWILVHRVFLGANARMLWMFLLSATTCWI